MKRIQDTPQYKIVKAVSSAEASRNTRRVIWQAAKFVFLVYTWMYILAFWGMS